MTLTFDLYVGGGGVSLVSFTHRFYLVIYNYNVPCEHFVRDSDVEYCMKKQVGTYIIGQKNFL